MSMVRVAVRDVEGRYKLLYSGVHTSYNNNFIIMLCIHNLLFISSLYILRIKVVFQERCSKTVNNSENLEKMTRGGFFGAVYKARSCSAKRINAR